MARGGALGGVRGSVRDRSFSGDGETAAERLADGLLGCHFATYGGLGSVVSRPIRSRLYAATDSCASRATRSSPRKRVFLQPP
jgi:hypothetical protein